MSITQDELAGKITSEVIRPGCYFCKRLYQQVQEAAAEQEIDSDIFHVTDIKTALRHIPFIPVLKMLPARWFHRKVVVPKSMDS